MIKKSLMNRLCLWTILTITAIAVLTFGGIALANAVQPTSSNIGALSAQPEATPCPSPPEFTHPTPYRGTFEEENAAREKALEELKKNGGFVYSTQGLSTMGGNISVGNTLIHLPADAYVAHYADCVDCAAGASCPRAPIYVIARGNSTITFEKASGKVLHKSIAPDEKTAFDFLKGVTK